MQDLMPPTAGDTLAAGIATPRLVLEPLRAAHAAACFGAFAEPSLYRYIEMPMPESEGALRRRFADWMKGSDRPGERWANWIATETRSGQPVGWFQATVHERHADIAYLVFGEFQRRGMAVEAVQALCRHLFATTPIDEIRAQTDERNKGSIRVALAAGFVVDEASLASSLHGEPTRDLLFRLVRTPAGAR